MQNQINEIEIKSWLHENAQQVKSFELDRVFIIGSIRTFERIDKGFKGYDIIERRFTSFEELKSYYAGTNPKINSEESSEGRTEMASTSTSTTDFGEGMVGDETTG